MLTEATSTSSGAVGAAEGSGAEGGDTSGFRLTVGGEVTPVLAAEGAGGMAGGEGAVGGANPGRAAGAKSGPGGRGPLCSPLGWWCPAVDLAPATIDILVLVISTQGAAIVNPALLNG